MSIVFLLFGLLLSVLILYERKLNEKVLAYLIIGVFLIRKQTIVGTLDTFRILPFVCFLCALFQFSKTTKELSKMPFFWLFAAIFVNYMLIAVNDNRLSMGTLVGRSFFRYLTTFFFLIIGYLSIQRNSDVTKYIKLFYALSIIVFGYTMIGLILHDDLVTMLGGRELDLTIDDRTKVPSITGFVYNGFIGSMLSILAFYNPYKLLTNKRRWILFIMGTVMIIAAGFRVNIIAFVGGMVLAFVLGRSKKAIKPLALAGVLSIALYMVLPSFSDLVNSTLSLSSGESDVGGSSGNMRIQQWAIAYSYLLEKPLWGHGFSYLSENIMAFYGRDGQSGGLMGGEGYYILMFIEEGGIQVILSTIFFVFFIIYFMKKKQYTFGNIGIALTGMYFIFCLGTRPDDTWGYILPLIGVCLRQIVLTQQEEKAKSNNIKKQLQ